MKHTNILFATALLIGTAACQQQPTDDANIAIDNQAGVAAATADGTVETLPPSEEASNPNIVNGINEADDAGSEAPPTLLIPAQYRGRWGLVPADCTSTRGDAKGLMTVRDTSIKFYESLASLQEQRPAIATSFSGVYSFEGEGQQWERVITLTRTGDTLKRAQADGTFTYTRCK